MLVTEIKIEAFRIGMEEFYVDRDGCLREIQTGRKPNNKEWQAYNEYLDRVDREEKKKEEYEKAVEEENNRHETALRQLKSIL